MKLSCHKGETMTDQTESNYNLAWRALKEAGFDNQTISAMSPEEFGKQGIKAIFQMVAKEKENEYKETYNY